MSSQDDSGFRSLLEYIEANLEFETGFYNDSYLDRRISARMRRTNREDYRAYQTFLDGNEEEAEALLDSLSINVTGFFRNPEAWEKLRSVLRDLSAREKTVRIWSAPCADGREPYSIAMLALDDDGIDGSAIEILATDINEDILEVARKGVYETSQTTDIEEELEPLEEYAPYIDREGDTFQVRPNVKRLVSFERHDLISGDPKRNLDLVLCRNLLIYIDSSYKTPIFETIRESLRSGAYLMVGMTETLPKACRDDFEPVYRRQRIYRRV